jgi:hypothetical protein
MQATCFLEFLWLPGVVGHAGACVVTLPQVVVSKGKNWIRLWK